MKYIKTFESFNSKILSRWKGLENNKSFKTRLVNDLSKYGIDISRISDDDILYLSYMEYIDSQSIYQHDNYKKYFFKGDRFHMYNTSGLTDKNYDYVLILDTDDLKEKYPVIKYPKYTEPAYNISRKLNKKKEKYYYDLAKEGGLDVMYHFLFKSVGDNLLYFFYSAQYGLLTQIKKTYDVIEKNDIQFKEYLEVIIRNAFNIKTIHSDLRIKQYMLDNDLNYDKYLDVKKLIHNCSIEILNIYEKQDINSFIYTIESILHTTFPKMCLHIGELSDTHNFVSYSNISTLESIYERLLEESK